MSFELIGLVIGLIGLVIGFIAAVAGVIQAWLAWQQRREGASRPLNSKETMTRPRQTGTKIQKTAKIPWGG